MREDKVNVIRYRFDLQHNTDIVKGCSKYHSETVIIPVTTHSEGKEFKVMSIDDEAFLNCSKIPVITIPESVVNIGNEAFAYCYLTNFTCKAMIPTTADDPLSTAARRHTLRFSIDCEHL